MQRLVNHGLRRTERDAELKQGMEDGIQAALAVKEVVDKAVQASPEAAIAWVGVCFALEVGTIVMNRQYMALTCAVSDHDEPAHSGKL
jgi:hypothetical protein